MASGEHEITKPRKPREFVLAWNSQGIIQATELPEDWNGEIADHAIRVREVLSKNYDFKMSGAGNP